MNEEHDAAKFCPVCGWPTVDQKGKQVCARCKIVVSTCCEGGRG